MRLITRVCKGIRQIVFSAFVLIMVIIFMSGAEISINYNISKVKENIWGKGVQVVKIANTFRKAVQ